MSKSEPKDPLAPKDEKAYLQSSEELSDELNEDIEHIVASEERTPSSKKFWKSWPTKKKVIVAASSTFGVILLFSGILFLGIRPSKTNGYIKSSWHNLVLDSSELDRAIGSEVNLAGTRDLADGLYNYNNKLGSVSYDSKSKGSIFYDSGATKEYGELADTMRDYFSASATSLAKSNTDIESISEDELNQLEDQGVKAKEKVDAFRTKFKLQEDLNPSLFALDDYIHEVKLTAEKIAKEKAEEEKRQQEELAAKAAKDAKDKADVQAVSDSYFKAYINGNEDGVRATLSKGYQTEYDYSTLRADKRTNYYPRSYRLVDSVKDGDNYKVTASVTQVSVYEGDETIFPVTMIYRVVFAQDTQSWKIDGQLDR